LPEEQNNLQQSGQTGGVANSGTFNTNGGHVVGGNLSINSPEAVVEALAARGLLQIAETAGLQRQVVVMLAQRLKPADRLDFEQAIIEVERAVEIAIEVIARGARGSNEDAFVNAVLAEAAAKTQNIDLDGAAQSVDDAFIEFEKQEGERRDAAKRRGIIILEAAIRQHTLRRDAVTVTQRIERIVAIEHATERPAWHPAFRAQYDKFREEGETRGVNFSLEVAIERESGTARLEQAVNAYRDALREYTHERVPLDWATTQNNLGNALQRLGQRESGTARLEQAVNAFRDALQERTRERVPLDWATTQNNLGNALATLGERDSGTAWREQAAAAWDACFTVTASVWPSEWVDAIRSRRDKTLAEIARRSSRKS
jgi:tetratricopeptide (TPR) repeat protein